MPAMVPAALFVSTTIALRLALLIDRARRMARVEPRFADTRNHMDVAAERLRDEIRLVAEGCDTLRSDMADVKAGQARLEQKFERLELRQLALERRVPQ